MKVTLYYQEVNLATYSDHDLKMFVDDLVDDISFYSCHNRDADYDHARDVLDETLEYILFNRRA